jgi:putative ABC transport system permease protein
MLGDPVRSGLLAIAGAVVLVMLIACVNAAGLLLVRGLARQQELALRAALGGSRAAIFRHVLTESLVLALLSGIAATLFAWASLRAMLALVPETLIRFNYNTIGIDGRVLGFALALTVLTGLLFGMAPALRASRTNVARAGRAGTATAAHVRLRGLLQVLQLAFAVMLLAGATLLGRSFLHLMAVNPGFDFDRLLLLTYYSTAQRRAEPGAVTAFQRELDARIRAVPGVSGVSWSDGTGFFVGYTIETEGSDPRPSGDELLPFSSVDPSYFRVMGIPILRGRGFDASDMLPGANTAVIDIDLANSLWPGENAVGRRFRIRENPWLTVVGVSADVKLDGPNDPYGRSFIFYPRAVDRFTGGTVSVRTEGRPASLARAVRDIVTDLDPGQPFELVTGEESRYQSVAQQRFLLVIMTAFASVALLLAGIGIYSLVAFVVGQRTREIGVRMAIGARAELVMAEVLGSGLRLAIAGATIGVLGAMLLARLIERLLFGVAPIDPVALVTSIAVLLVCCAAALIAPARRAASIPPSVALRSE